MKEDYPESGDFVIRVTLTAEIDEGQGYPLLEVSLGYRPDTQILMREFDLVEVRSTEEQTFEFRGRLEEYPLPVRGQGKYPGLVVRVRNRFDDRSPRPQVEKVDNKKFYPDEPHLASIDIKKGNLLAVSSVDLLELIALRQNDELAYATEVLGRFMNRAYRRPVSVEEVETIVGFKTVRPDFPTFEGAMIEALSLVLIRPEFLYMMEPSGDEKRPVNQWELASRLSYFLWSTMPDSGLVELAEQQKLANPKIMVEQVQRMLEDPRSDRFFRQFSEQWLQLKNMESVSIHPKLYPDFDERLRDDMKRESVHF